MMTSRPNSQSPEPKPSVITWLLDSDPSIRWQVMRDLTKEPAEVVAAERAKVATQGWGAQLLGLQRPDSTWGDGSPRAMWESTLYTMLLLRAMGLDSHSAQARKAVDLLHEKFSWGPQWGDTKFFEGEVEPCINGGVLALGAYFGGNSDRLLDRLLGEQLKDGGWNCEAENGSVRSSFHTTIDVLDGLLEYENAKSATAAVTDARLRAQEYLLERRMYRSLSSGEVIRDRKQDSLGRTSGRSDWTHFSFPTTWHYDVLRGLDYLRNAGAEPDERVAEAVDIVAKKQQKDGRWLLENPHHDPVGLDMEGGKGKASRWNTLRALRVLDWYSSGS